MISINIMRKCLWQLCMLHICHPSQPPPGDCDLISPSDHVRTKSLTVRELLLKSPRPAPFSPLADPSLNSLITRANPRSYQPPPAPLLGFSGLNPAGSELNTVGLQHSLTLKHGDLGLNASLRPPPKHIDDQPVLHSSHLACSVVQLQPPVSQKSAADNVMKQPLNRSRPRVLLFFPHFIKGCSIAG